MMTTPTMLTVVTKAIAAKQKTGAGTAGNCALR